MRTTGTYATSTTLADLFDEEAGFAVSNTDLERFIHDESQALPPPVQRAP